jgi:hypothetical protein
MKINIFTMTFKSYQKLQQLSHEQLLEKLKLPLPLSSKAKSIGPTIHTNNSGVYV